VTFGAYKGKHVNEMLKDRGLCAWLLKQDWFEARYTHLFRRVLDYEPRQYLLKDPPDGVDSFVECYPFFNLVDPEQADTPIGLTPTERTCFTAYVAMVDNLRQRIRTREDDGEENIYDIKAPTRLMIEFETEYALSRDAFKEFITAHDLPTIASIVEDIKREGGLEYKGRRAFLIAKERSLKQEAYWEEVLKSRFREDLGSQFKFDDCLFDFIVIPTRTVYECKLGFKDYQDAQYDKYTRALKGRYNVVYLIGEDTVIDMNSMKIYTSNLPGLLEYLEALPNKKKPTKLDELLPEFELCHGENLHLACLVEKSELHLSQNRTMCAMTNAVCTKVATPTTLVLSELSTV
jgi:hypothetical protein